MIQRLLLHEKGGDLRISDAGPETLGVFDACHLRDHFTFCPDEAAAIHSLAAKPSTPT